MAGDAGDHCRGALAHLDVRSQPVAESGFRFAAERLVRQQLGVHLPQGAVFRGGRIAFSSDPSVVLGRDDAVLSGLAVADGGARQNHQVQMGALHGDSCHHGCFHRDMVLLFDPANTSRVYYGTDTRLAELAAGALLAIWIALPREVRKLRKLERLRKQCRSNVRPATRRRPSHYRLQCSWHRGFGGTADRILVRQRVSVVHVPRRVPDYRVHIVVRLGLCREQ